MSSLLRGENSAGLVTSKRDAGCCFLTEQPLIRAICKTNRIIADTRAGVEP